MMQESIILFKKKESKAIFLNFFDELASSVRRSQEGVYTSYTFGGRGHRVQIILLDTRSFWDDLIDYKGALKEDKRYFYNLDYSPHTSSDSTLLGSEQWKWLEQQFMMLADIRIIGSSTQY